MSKARDLHLNVPQILRKDIAYTVTSGEAQSMGTLPANSIITAVTTFVETAFNAGTTNVLIVGTSADDDAYLAAADSDETSTGLTRYTGKAAKLSADTEIFMEYTQTGTAATAGAAVVMVEYVTDNG